MTFNFDIRSECKCERKSRGIQNDKWSIVSLKGNKSHTVFLLLGGNLGDTEAYFDSCKAQLIEHGMVIIQASSVYRSEPWGMADAPWFLNQVLQIRCTSSADALLKLLLEIERGLGRERQVDPSAGYASRSIDIDILYFDDLILETKDLTIPHPRLHLRRFTLLPLTEIAPNWLHPVFQMDQQALLANCEDEGTTLKDG